ncbi:MAG: polysaccharide lyase family 7 protein [Pseudonocardia sp.]
MLLPALALRVVLAAALPLVIGTGPVAAESPSVAPAERTAPAPAGCELPAQVLDLTNWKVTLPLPMPDNATGPLEIAQPQLASYARPPYFRTTPTCDAVVFQAPVNGVHTSGSRYPRSELREMTDAGANKASWSSGAGEHRMTVTEAFTHLPVGKPELIGAQIHDANDDVTVFRLEGNNLWITDDNDPHHKLITDHYVLGTKFDATYEVSGGTIRAYYNGVLQTTISNRFRDAYFKAGAYTQSNCTTAARCASDNYGETTIYQVTVFHHVTTWDLILDWIITWGPIALLVVVVLVIGYGLVRRLRAR